MLPTAFHCKQITSLFCESCISSYPSYPVQLSFGKMLMIFEASWSGADVHDERQDLQLLCLLPAHQQDRCAPGEKSALSNSRKYRTQTHQHCVCIYLCALWSSQTPATRPRRAHNTNSLNLRMTRSNSSRGGSLPEDVMTQHFSPWCCAPFNIKQSEWDSSSCGVTLSFRMTSGNSTPPATVYLPLSWKDTRSQK